MPTIARDTHSYYFQCCRLNMFFHILTIRHWISYTYSYATIKLPFSTIRYTNSYFSPSKVGLTGKFETRSYTGKYREYIYIYICIRIVGVIFNSLYPHRFELISVFFKFSFVKVGRLALNSNCSSQFQCEVSRTER